MLERTRLACSLAREAGALIREAFGRRRSVEFKSAVDLVTDVDRAAQALILDGIRRVFPADTVVAEEDGASAPDRSGAGPCWYVDPLDGTTNFVHSLPHFAVSIAWHENGRARGAAVYDPSRDELFHAETGEGAFLDDVRLAVSEAGELDRALLVTGFPYDRRAHVDRYLESFREFLCSARDLRRYGSASLDLCYVAAGRFDGFWEWGLAPWDTAAGALVLLEAGGRISDFDGGPWDPWMPRILASNGLLHGQMEAVLARGSARSRIP